MADNSLIEWCDATCNAVNGCSVVSPGCTNCYAMRLAGTRMRTHPTRAGLTIDSKAGPVWTGEVRLHDPALLQPLKWKRPRRIFWNAHGDLFHDAVPDEWIDRVFAVCALTPQHTHMILTKRPRRMREYFYFADSEWRDRVSMVINDWPEDRIYHGNEFSADFDVLMADNRPLPNVWLGVSVEDQARADERREDFASTPAAVKFVSYEPALGPVDWTGWEFADQIISGGEGGPRARPSHPDWHRAARDFSAANDMAYFFKQWGEWLPCEVDNPSDGSGTVCYPDDGSERDNVIPEGSRRAITSVSRQDFWRVGKKAAGRLLDGVTHDAFPEARHA